MYTESKGYSKKHWTLNKITITTSDCIQSKPFPPEETAIVRAKLKPLNQTSPQQISGPQNTFNVNTTEPDYPIIFSKSSLKASEFL